MTQWMLTSGLPARELAELRLRFRPVTDPMHKQVAASYGAHAEPVFVIDDAEVCIDDAALSVLHHDVWTSTLLSCVQKVLEHRAMLLCWCADDAADIEVVHTEAQWRRVFVEHCGKQPADLWVVLDAR